ncbi:hypothetical protein [Pseudarthrobacter cellobiosi]|uniref:hypothetical protein n=1 Tax=Pseudarthrobacter cellobiosi TaxID=2953654 RepID=UPI00208E8837|nr:MULTISPECIES: hypothetical protein [unclassified Pseudarthrobacter]MCO4256738.1 hypothetical protein [Pseudarthrobacter sp. HLT1-5]MCO4275076.1 hypothetical protein [Pseudarthrobacter sp. HLT3-5]
MGDPAENAPKVPATLELRIHGIRNTPPHELLRSGKRSLKPDDVELSWGDELAGFYRAKVGAGAVVDSGAGAAANGGSPRVVEAYSWGRLARFTGVGMAGKVADAAVRTAWFLLMPFGLTNAAYWSRPLPAVKQQVVTDPASGQAEPRIDYADGVGHGRDGAGRIRLFALVLTLYFVVTAAVVSMDLIAVQCFPADVPGQERRVCSALPAFLDGLAGWTRGQRIVVFALIPIVSVAVLAAIAYLARTRFHPRPNLGTAAQEAAGAGAEEISALPTLMIRNLWEARKEIRYNGWLHVWAALAAVGAIIAWDGLWTRIDGIACGSLGTFFTECALSMAPGRIDLTGIAMAFAWLVAAGAVVLAGIETVRKSPDNPDMPSRDGSSLMGWISGGAIISVLAAGLAAVLSGAPDGEVPGATRMLGLGTAPAGLMFVMLVLILTMSQLRREGYDKRTLGWHGKGSAVFSTLALGAATILSCAIVGAAATVLQRNLERRAATADGMWRYGSMAGDVLMPPSVFSLFSGLLLGVIVAGAVAWGLCTWRAVRSMTWNTQEAAVSELLSAYSAAPPLPQQEAAGRKLVAARRTASLAHRAEAVVSLLAILIFLGLLSALILGTFKDWWNAGPAAGLYRLIESMGALGLAAAGATIVALAVMSAKPNSRPLALLWDLMCFMPKTAHPFGPPSYGERAVPEFAARIAAWLDGMDGAPAAKTGMVAISAHSLGAVIAVSALFHLKSTRPDLPFNRIGLLTYGTQLRSYFGRFFPELLGPAVLATAPVGRTKLTAAGSPDDERVVTGEPTVQFDVNLSHVLGAGPNRWVNLYRKTDYLGFPVLYQGPGGAENVGSIPDRYAQEMDPFTYQFLVVSHSDYLQAPQYDEAIAAVVNSLPAPRP